MNAALRHRGPDEGGAVDLGYAVLGMRRLAIVDRAGGRQPMRSAESGQALVFNGEIYDCDELRERLRRSGSSGRQLRGRSDTEVLLALWEAEGEACLPALNGIFAFAVAESGADDTHSSAIIISALSFQKQQAGGIR
jgi:asparagine synthase (glutamine-hydrolysing)